MSRGELRRRVFAARDQLSVFRHPFADDAITVEVAHRDHDALLSEAFARDYLDTDDGSVLHVYGIPVLPVDHLPPGTVHLVARVEC